MTRRVLVAAATLVAVCLTAAPARAEWTWPVRGEVITPYRNGDDPYASGQHRGIDIAADPGSSVVAAAGGEVRFAGTAGSSGVTVSIRSDDGLYDTSYLHLSAAAIHAGERVAAGDRVGAVGTTGVRSVERPHLHFGVRDAGSRHAYQDPLAFLPPPALAPERPRATPAPSPMPVPLAPVPRPVRVPAPRRAPLPRSAPRRAPAPRSVPRPIPRSAPRRVPIPRSAPTPVPIPRIFPRRAPADRSVPSRPHSGARDRVRIGSRDPVADRAPQTAPTREVRSPVTPGSPPSRGPDAGWVLACLGLLAASALLGLSEDGRRATRRGRQRITTLVSPRLGGR